MMYAVLGIGGRLRATTWQASISSFARTVHLIAQSEPDVILLTFDRACDNRGFSFGHSNVDLPFSVVSALFEYHVLSFQWILGRHPSVAPERNY